MIVLLAFFGFPPAGQCCDGLSCSTLGLGVVGNIVRFLLSLPLSVDGEHPILVGWLVGPSFIHQVIIITGLNKLQLYVLALKMALDADRA